MKVIEAEATEARTVSKTEHNSRLSGVLGSELSPEVGVLTKRERISVDGSLALARDASGVQVRQ